MLINVRLLLKWSERFVWESSRALRVFQRRFGVMGWLIAACVVTIVVLMLVDGWQSKKLNALQKQVEESRRAILLKEQSGAAFQEVSSGADGRALLRMFEKNLLPHENIPSLIQDLLQIANEEGVLIKRGDYRLEADSPGGFMRYRMDLPVQGAALAIDRFIQRALAAWKALALHSVRFTRTEIGSDIIESRLQWVAMVEMPKTTSPPVRSAPGDAK